MSKVKGFVVLGSIVGAFLVVYGSAILFRLLMGLYFLDGGLADPNYAYLAILCAVPFALNQLIYQKQYSKPSFIGECLFILLFVIVHGVLVFSTVETTYEIVVRTLIVFPVSAFLMVIATRFGVSIGNVTQAS